LESFGKKPKGENGDLSWVLIAQGQGDSLLVYLVRLKMEMQV
jgi:hypothetical protein